jgi:oxygen-independent coproporphyrinogen-3 oxidase
MGAQSFNPDHLKTLERWHDPASVPAALETVRRAGISRTSIDLIFAIPGQSLADWQSDIDRALALGLDHLSCYNLTYEPNTAMTKRLQRGDFAPVPDDLEIAMYTHTVDTLARAGLDRYEVSNFARAGQQSRHNLVYWRGEPWLAAGPSASGYARGWRWKNIPRLPDYLESSGFSPAIDLEPPDAGRALRERLMMGLRLSEGLPIEDLLDAARVIHPSIPAALTRAAAALQREGLLEPFPDRWQLTHAGFLGADRVAARLMAAAHPPDA